MFVLEIDRMRERLLAHTCDCLHHLINVFCVRKSQILGVTNQSFKKPLDHKRQTFIYNYTYIIIAHVPVDVCTLIVIVL